MRRNGLAVVFGIVRLVFRSRLFSSGSKTREPTLSPTKERWLAAGHYRFKLMGDNENCTLESSD